MNELSRLKGTEGIEEQQLQEQALTWPERARRLRVDDTDSCLAAGEELLAIKALRAEVEAVFGPVVRKAYEAHRAAVMARAKVDEPLVEAERVLKGAIGIYETEQRRIHEQRERAERDRQERELEKQREAELEQAEAEGATHAEIAEIAARPLPVPIVAMRPPARLTGVNIRDNWKAVVEDKLKLVRYCGSNPDHLNLVEANTTALNALARALKSVMNVPGVKVVKEAIVAAGRKGI
jgi:hypothetical protein